MAWLRSAYRWASWVLATPVMALGGVPLLRRALVRLRAGRLSMDALIAAGSLAAYGLSTYALFAGSSRTYFESATIAIVLATFGRYLESTARSRASRSLGQLLEVSRETVRIARPDGSMANVAASEITPGMRVHIEAEQVVPVDLRLELENAEVDLAVLSGEARPVPVVRGDVVPAGAVPTASEIVGTAVRAAKDSAVERLAALARSLSERPSAALRWADRFASFLTPAACAISLLAVVYWTHAASLEVGILNGLAVVLVACPCAYAIASPLVHWLCLREAFAHGVLIRSPEVLGALAGTRVVAFDKTGTLTSPELSVAKERISPCTSRDEVRSIVHALETGSTHPIAKALVAHAGAAEPSPISGRKFLPGRGVTALDGRGRELFLGVGRDGRSVLRRDGVTLASFELDERLRPEAPEAVAALKNDGIRVALLSGDARDRAEAVAARLGIEAQAPLSPQQKLAALEALGPHTAMVGDGINDVPALAGRSTSFTFGGATQLAKGVAQVTLIEPDLRLVPWSLALSRRGLRRVKWLIAWATTYNLVFVALAAGGALRPVWAGLSMLVSSLLSLAFAAGISSRQTPEDDQAADAVGLSRSEAASC